MLLPRPSSSPSARPTRRARQGHEGRRRGLPDVPSECAPQVLSTLSLPPALQLDTAELVYNDCLACAWRAEHAALPAPTARRGGLSNRAQLPDAEALAVLVQVRRARHTIAAIEGGGGGGRGCLAVLQVGRRSNRGADARLSGAPGWAAPNRQAACPASGFGAGFGADWGLVCAPAQAFAAAADLRSAAKYYKQLRRSGRSGLAAVSVSHRRMWELLIESYCRQVGGQGWRAWLGAAAARDVGGKAGRMLLPTHAPAQQESKRCPCRAAAQELAATFLPAAHPPSPHSHTHTPAPLHTHPPTRPPAEQGAAGAAGL